MSRASMLTLTALGVASALAGSVALGVGSAGAPATDAGIAAQAGNTPYDGRFTFARIRFGGGGLTSGSFRGRGRRRQPGWAHDFSRAERNFMGIIRETMVVRRYMDGGNIFDTVDPDLSRFPLSYISEPSGSYALS